jgi:hypothetical protein
MKFPMHVAGLWLASGLALAQPAQVILAEVNPSPAGQWIELLNRTNESQDISSWSLHLATMTPLWPQQYWYGFPAGTVIPANGRLRVNWGSPIQALPPANTINTGNTIFHFLFGLGFEPLPLTAGAMALIRSQQNSQMNTPSLFEDWVSWGQGNFLREILAVQAGRWVLGRFVPAPVSGDSLARMPQVIGQMPSPDREWFRDASPTPLAPNAPGYTSTSIGIPCVQPGHTLLGPPVLGGIAFPVAGARDFALAVSNTTGVPGTFGMFVFSVLPAPPSQPPLLPPGTGPACPELVDFGTLIAFFLVQTAVNETLFPVSFAATSSALQGGRFVVQTVLFDASTTVPPYQGTTNAVDYTIGG